MELRELLRDAAMISLLVIVFMLMFVFHYALNSIELSKTEILSKNSMTGHVVDIGGKKENKYAVAVEEPKPYQEAQLTQNMQCWKDSGVKDEDIKVVGKFIDKIECTEKNEKSGIKVELKGDCILLDSNNGIRSEFCMPGEDIPSYALNLITAGEPPKFVPERNYNYFIIFLLSILLSITAWGIFDMRHRPHKPEGFNAPFMDVDEVEVRYIKTPPKYKEGMKSFEEIEEMHKKLIRERDAEKAQEIEKLKLRQNEIQEYLDKFEDLYSKADKELTSGNVKEAKRYYLELFPVYTRLFNSLDLEKKGYIQEKIKKIHDSIKIVEKSIRIRELIDKAYAEVDKINVIEQPEKKEIPQKRQEAKEPYPQNKLRELGRLHDLLAQGHYEQAKKELGYIENKIESKSDYKNKIIDFSSLEEISRIHDKLKSSDFKYVRPKEISELKKDISALKELINKKKGSEARERYRKLFKN